jgi:TRAP-type uncharacterized transport system substrate-binding protein
MLNLKRRAFLASMPLAAWARSGSAAQTMFRFGTAAEGGSFMVYALAFLDAMRTVDPAFEIRSVATDGTTENVAKLEAGDLDIAMVSGEVAHELFEGIGRPACSRSAPTAAIARSAISRDGPSSGTSRARASRCRRGT